MTEVAWIGPDLRLVRAANAGPLTGTGTNSYLLGRGTVTVIDPGPDAPDHLAALEAALEPGERIDHVLVTHAHRDHSALAPRLGSIWGAPVLAFGDARAGRSPLPAALAGIATSLRGGEGVDGGFVPDRCLADAETLDLPAGTVTALWTPGHFGNHLCFLWRDIAFSGDHVMGWATSIVSPPEGDMAAYMRSLDRLAAAGPKSLLPGHGPAVHDPVARIAALAAHRRAREAAIRAALTDVPAEVTEITRTVYRDTPAPLLQAAERNVLAHLIDLCTRGAAQPAPQTPAGAAPSFVRG
jgi:hydroxyacylglutathione hydrolase